MDSNQILPLENYDPSRTPSPTRSLPPSTDAQNPNKKKEMAPPSEKTSGRLSSYIGYSKYVLTSPVPETTLWVITNAHKSGTAVGRVVDLPYSGRSRGKSLDHISLLHIDFARFHLEGHATFKCSRSFVKYRLCSIPSRDTICGMA